MAIIIRTVQNISTSHTNITLPVPGYDSSKFPVVIIYGTTVDLFTVMSGDQLEAIQTTLNEYVSAGQLDIIATVDTTTFNPVGGGGSSGVSSVNSITGAVTLAAGSNVTITPSGSTLTIASSGGSGITALTGDVTASGSGSVAATVVSAGSGTGAFSAGALTIASIKGSANPLIITSASDAINAIEFQDIEGNPILHINTLNRRVGINTTTPSQPLEVDGNVAIDGQLAMGSAAPSGACLIDMINPYTGLGLTVLTDAQMAAVTPNRMGNILWNSTANALYANNGTTWAAVGGGGSSTPNTAQGTLTSAVTTSSTSFVSTGLTVTLAASTATSPLLIMVSSAAQTFGADSGYFTIFRDDTTNIASPAVSLQKTACNSLVPMAFQTLYTPGDTASHTYTVYMESMKGDVLQFGATGYLGEVQCRITVVDLSA